MGYAELHCHSNYSFKEGASSVEELLIRARELGYPALALTDHDNLCGAMHFAQMARGLDIQPITGAEITLKDGSHLTLLAATRKGYNNLCNLITYSYLNNRQNPNLDPNHLQNHTEGIILLTGCPKGQIPRLIAEGRHHEAEILLCQYLDWFGSTNVFVELEQRLVWRDLRCNRQLAELARKLGLGIVATNNVHYHLPERRRLQDALVAIQHNKSLEETHQERRVNGQFYLKSHQEMATLFQSYPEAIRNTLRITERCAFNLTRDLDYQFPDYPVPETHTPQSYLEELCYQAAQRRYGRITDKVKARLAEEFRLIRKHNLAGFLLIYHEIIQLARQIMIELGLSDPEIPLEERPPGRGRGSSVAMLVGYLIGLSHIDPLEYNLSLERFLPEDAMAAVPDIDLDFPRNIREELIKRVHEKWGWDCAALTGMISTYQLKGAIRDLSKALGLPRADVNQLAKRVESHSAQELALEMSLLPEFKDRIDAPVWQDLIDLATQLDGFPKYLAQHPGGMIISSSPLVNLVPVQPGAIEGRYIVQWDKDAIDAAGFIKIDFLALGALSQMQEALQLIEERTQTYLDLSRIDFADEAVYGVLHRADTIGIFQVESAAQMQTIPRIKPKDLTDMAYEVAAVRPGVGANDGVSVFIARRSHPMVPWDYDHPLEHRALERTLGVILFQDQVNQLAIDVAGFSPTEADGLRRAFTKRNNLSLIALYWQKFRQGAVERGVPEEVAEKIFKKFNGHYMFPESHAFAFGVTAYQMAWLKHYYPLEFFVAIFNQQPMGFYSLETLKEDAKRHGVKVLNPDINTSLDKCIIKNGSLLLGFLNVRGVGESGAAAIIEAREWDGAFPSLADAIERTGLKREALENLVLAGAFDSLVKDRKRALWEAGLHYRPKSAQLPLQLPVEQDLALLPVQTPWEVVEGEYRTLSLFPAGHIMGMLRPHLDQQILTSQQILDLPQGAQVTVAGLVIRRQRPLGRAVFITLEDEFGHIPLVVWPKVHHRLRLVLRESLLIARGVVSRQEGTINIVVQQARRIKGLSDLPKAKNWH
jgi:error-prone DNA polymerase